MSDTKIDHTQLGKTIRNVEKIELRLEQLEQSSKDQTGILKKVESNITDIKVLMGKIETKMESLASQATVNTIEERTKHMASKHWVLGGALIAAGVAATIVIGVLNLWPPSSSADQELVKIIFELTNKIKSQ